MTDMTIPAPAIAGSTDSAAPQVTTQDTSAEQIATAPQAEEPAGDEQQKKTWEEKRKERNRERWQQYKQAKEVLPQQLAVLQREVDRLKAVTMPDLSQITDPAEELATRTAHKVREAQVTEAEARLNEERRQVAEKYKASLDAAWDETVENARATMPDFDTVFSKDVPFHERAARHLIESENAAEIAYYLGKNRAEAASLYQAFESDPYSALIKFGQLQAKIAAAPAKSTSTAPKPAAVLGGGKSPLAFDASRASVSDMAAHLKKAGLIR